jgi:hypothetical protein
VYWEEISRQRTPLRPTVTPLATAPVA